MELKEGISSLTSDCTIKVQYSKQYRSDIKKYIWIMEKAKEFQKNIYFCSIDYTKAIDCVGHNKLWKILKDGNTRPSVSGETCVQVKKQQLGPNMELTGSKLGKRVCKGCMLLPCLFNLYAEYIMWNARLDDSQTVIKIAGKISATSDMRCYHSNVKRN